MRDSIRNATSYVVVFVLTVVAWLYIGPLWSSAFLVGRTFESEWSLALFWGFDLLLALLGGFALAFSVSSNRPMLWVAALGFAFTLLKIRFTKQWTSPDADWTVYLEGYSHYVVPLLGALVGGFLAHWVRVHRTPTAAPNNRWRGP